jgi:hypothetical protein
MNGGGGIRVLVGHPMKTERERQQIDKACGGQSFLSLIAEETRETSKRLCEEAVVAQKVSQEIVQMSRLLRQRRKEFIHNLTESTST